MITAAIEMSGEALAVLFKEYLVVSLLESKFLSMTAIEESTFSSVYFVVTESNSSEVKDVCVASDTFFMS
jgi:hypothetical protein|tara:strand:+ start:405 stop:614 length:210 start_codon:yes stop_codon:yes gene_type:complete